MRGQAPARGGVSQTPVSPSPFSPTDIPSLLSCLSFSSLPSLGPCPRALACWRHRDKELFPLCKTQPPKTLAAAAASSTLELIGLWGGSGVNPANQHPSHLQCFVKLPASPVCSGCARGADHPASPLGNPEFTGEIT